MGRVYPNALRFGHTTNFPKAECDVNSFNPHAPQYPTPGHTSFLRHYYLIISIPEPMKTSTPQVLLAPFVYSSFLRLSLESLLFGEVALPLPIKVGPSRRRHRDIAARAQRRRPLEKSERPVAVGIRTAELVSEAAQHHDGRYGSASR